MHNLKDEVCLSANVLIGPSFKNDLRTQEIFFGPLSSWDVCIQYDHVPSWAEIFDDLGIFSSRAEAKRQGWTGVPEIGYTDTFRPCKRKWKTVTVLREGWKE